MLCKIVDKWQLRRARCHIRYVLGRTANASLLPNAVLRLRVQEETGRGAFVPHSRVLGTPWLVGDRQCEVLALVGPAV